MQTLKLTVEADGRVTIPGAKPGQTVTIQLSPEPEPEGSERLTLATARTEAERAAVIARIRRLAGEIREGLPEPWKSADHGDLLYDENGLPK
jgi:hypothetical protein